MMALSKYSLFMKLYRELEPNGTLKIYTAKAIIYWSDDIATNNVE